MFDGLTIPLAVERTRRNPVRVPMRNLVINRGDDVTLAVQVYADGAGAVLDISGASVTVSLMRSHDQYVGWHDYGWAWWTYPQTPIWQGVGVIVDGSTGQANVTIPRATTGTLCGRHGFVVSLDDQFGGSVLTRGVFDVIGSGPVLAVGFTPGIVSILDGTITTVLTIPGG